MKSHTTPTPYGNNEKPVSFAIAVLAVAMLLAIAANKCSAQTGYLIVTQQSGCKVQMHKVKSSAEADSIVNAVFPGFETKTALNTSLYFEQKTQNSYVYIEKKHYVKTRKNGTIKLRRAKA